MGDRSPRRGRVSLTKTARKLPCPACGSTLPSVPLRVEDATCGDPFHVGDPDPLLSDPKFMLKGSFRPQGMYHDRRGVEISLGEFCLLLDDDDYRQVEHAVLGDVRVSTVWLGLNQNWFDEGPPVVFETMIFPECYGVGRAATEVEARALHTIAVAYVESGEYAAEARRRARYDPDLPDAASWSPEDLDEPHDP